MSTILDALRKLQRDREGKDAGQDLRRAVAQPARHRARSRGLLRSFVALLVLVVGAGAGAWFVIPEESATLVAAWIPLDRWLGSSAPEAEAPAPTSTARRAAPPPTARVPAPPPEPPAEVPVEQVPEVVARAEAPTLPTPPAPPQPAPVPARDPEQDAVVAARAAQAPPLSAAPESPVAPALPTTPEAATTDAEEERAKQEVAKLVAEKARKRRAELDLDEPRPRPPIAKPAAPASDAEEIPEIHLRSVRWHPQAPRRVVSLDLPQMGPLELREGDIAAGVLVRRIDPGSIEVQVGSARKRIALQP